MKAYESDPAKMYSELIDTCKKSIKVIKEIRFTRGIPDNLMYSEVKVLHLVRDPRAVLYSRLSLEAFCGNKGGARDCVQPLCQGFRATLRGITAYLATLEGRQYWQYYKFKRIKFEEVNNIYMCSYMMCTFIEEEEKMCMLCVCVLFKYKWNIYVL
jgi:hypothetical protein